MVDQRAILRLEVKKNDNMYTFDIPQGAPLSEAYAAIFDVLLMVKKTLDDEIEKQMLERSKKLGNNEEKVDADTEVEFKTDGSSDA